MQHASVNTNKYENNMNNAKENIENICQGGLSSTSRKRRVKISYEFIFYSIMKY